jgi:TusA-related sulfurtransferase
MEDVELLTAKLFLSRSSSGSKMTVELKYPQFVDDIKEYARGYVRENYPTWRLLRVKKCL